MEIMIYLYVKFFLNLVFEDHIIIPFINQKFQL